MSGIESWTTNPANNNQAPPFGWPAGILPSQVEPIGRQMMAALASWYQAAEWINYNFTPTYVSGTQFTMPGNVTSTFHVGRRVQATDGSTSVYGTITVSVFTTLTTVTVVWDSGVLQTGVTIVYVGIASKVNTSLPSVSFANPTALTGLSATNGTALTAARSDSAPALDQSIAPTWIGNHIFRTGSPTGTEGLKLDNSAGDARFGLYSAGTEYGILQAATNALNLTALGASTVLKFSVNNGAAISIAAAGAVTVSAPSSGVAVSVTANASSGALTLTGAGAGVEVLKVDDSAGDTRIGLYSAAVEYGLIQANTNVFSLSAIGASTALSLAVNAGTAVSIAAAGNVTINSPSSGSALATNSGAAATQSIDVKGFAGATAAAYLKFTAQNGAAIGFLGVSGSAQTLSGGATTGDMVLRADNGGISLSGNAGGSVGLRITTGNAVQGLGPVAAALVDMTPDKGSFTGAFTGFASAVTGTVTWVRVGNLVIMTLPYSGQSVLSNATTFTMTGIPASIQPATAGTRGQLGYCTDNSSVVAPGTSGATFSISGGTMTFYKGTSATGWTASGAKSIGTNLDSAAQFVFYSLN